MEVALIAAVAEDMGIGFNNDLLWHLPADMRFFKEQTTGHHVLTGRKNYESIPEKYRPLANRTNLIVTRQAGYKAPGAYVFDTIDAAMKWAAERGEKTLYVIGGGEVYRQTLPLADVLYLTRVQHRFKADTFFPELNNTDWEEEIIRTYPSDERNAYDMSFCTYRRRKKL